MKYSSSLALCSLSLILSIFNSYSAKADDQSANKCNTSCPSGQKVVSFTDGDNVACVCAPETNMVPTEPDPAVVNSGEYEDEGQKE